jgi:NAD-dependent SIR2 family protein deacetylase
VITTPTVLVLGAGVSATYGFPDASGLTNLIQNAFRSENSGASQLLSQGESSFTGNPLAKLSEAK